MLQQRLLCQNQIVLKDKQGTKVGGKDVMVTLISTGHGKSLIKLKLLPNGPSGGKKKIWLVAFEHLRQKVYPIYPVSLSKGPPLTECFLFPGGIQKICSIWPVRLSAEKEFLILINNLPNFTPQMMLKLTHSNRELIVGLFILNVPIGFKATLRHVNISLYFLYFTLSRNFPRGVGSRKLTSQPTNQHSIVFTFSIFCEGTIYL